MDPGSSVVPDHILGAGGSPDRGEETGEIPGRVRHSRCTIQHLLELRQRKQEPHAGVSYDSLPTSPASAETVDIHVRAGPLDMPGSLEASALPTATELAARNLPDVLQDAR